MSKRLPTFYIPHGGGPCFFMDWNPPGIWDNMANWLRALPAAVGQTPKAILMVSAHWEEDVFTVGSNPAPSLIYDYYGFPPHTYELKYGALGSPDLAARVRGLLQAQGIAAADDSVRGFDHGMFIPLMVSYPEASIPVIQLSLQKSLDPAAHIAVGQALEPLRDDGVLIIGSGMSYHNLRKFMRGTDGVIAESDPFDQWLTEAAMASPAERDQKLTEWQQAPIARDIHPREEHLIPLMVAAGAAGQDRGRQTFSDRVMGAMISGYQFG